jgi:hypothetical protein
LESAENDDKYKHFEFEASFFRISNLEFPILLTPPSPHAIF